MQGADYRAILPSIAARDPVRLCNIYHTVRRIPYGRTGQRDPATVVETNVGSCSGKHILLRGLLRAAKFDAEIITMFTHFDQGIPFNASYPHALRELLGAGEICDFHHYVRVRTDDLSGTKIRCIGLSSQRGTFALLDENVRPIGPAIVWNDSRARETAERLAARIESLASVNVYEKMYAYQSKIFLRAASWWPSRHSPGRQRILQTSDGDLGRGEQDGQCHNS